MEIDWCEYFSNIEADPHAMTPRLTIRQFFEARDHARECQDCYDRIERTVANNPEPPELPSSN